ncbi:uncharacterized protein LOC105442590 [Strongylocentrotus purpuratus]|uniref:Uncharacterized protein n=1 Tax=Strongylocentrotus purpuratus TaxID=7668 RepID=A0A7M7PJV4_STRPU|nr:uncharacterized protein LOC105442590 [Strongylocentrotus purpuratus]
MSSSLADALCNRTSIQELSLMEKTIFSNAWFSEENERKIDSKIEKVCIHGFHLNENDPTASRDLVRFLCLLPCLTDLMIKGSRSDSHYNRLFLLDDFYHELARQASSSKIEKVCIHGCHLNKNVPTASRDLARFLCLLPCLTELMIKGSDDQYINLLFLRDDFYHELARQAPSSKIEKVCIHDCDLNKNDPTASRDLARFLFFLPCLTDLTIKGSDDQFNHIFLHDDFYHELARQASSSKIEKVCIHGFHLNNNDPTASRDLARFLCLLPCLTDLTIKHYADKLFHRDDFYLELARQASSSKVIGKVF